MANNRWRREAEAWAQREAPVFVVAAARSGTTVLYRSLQSHPAFRPSGGPQLVESHAIANLHRAFGMDAYDRFPNLVSFVGEAEPWQRFLEDIEGLRRRRVAARRLSPWKLRDVRMWVAAGEHHVLRHYFQVAAGTRGAARLVEKTPSHLPWLDHLRRAFPNARFLALYRHPADVYRSYRKRFERNPTKAYWDVEPAGFAQRWSGETEAILRASAVSPDFLGVRYEDLVADPDTTMRAVLAHVGEPFDEGCLRGDAGTAASAEAEGAWDPIGARSTRAERATDDPDLVTVERLAEATMNAAGYERYTRA